MSGWAETHDPFRERGSTWFKEMQRKNMDLRKDIWERYMKEEGEEKRKENKKKVIVNEEKIKESGVKSDINNVWERILWGGILRFIIILIIIVVCW